MLRNMFIGNPPGNHDRILDFSTALTGGLFFVPTADFLENPPSPADSVAAAPPDVRTALSMEHPPRADGSLAIGSLRRSNTS
jgi:putative iron-dependent peroxidase